MSRKSSNDGMMSLCYVLVLATMVVLALAVRRANERISDLEDSIRTGPHSVEIEFVPVDEHGQEGDDDF